MPVEIFCCYARKDLEFLNELKTRLTPFQRQGLITLWADTDIGAGVEWEEEITKHLDTAQIILLFVSPDFLASDYIYRKEMKRAMERHERKEARVIPIILRKVHWQDVLGHLQALPKNGKEVTSWPNQDDAFYDVTNSIIQVARELNTKLPTTSQGKPKEATKPEQIQSPPMMYGTVSLNSAATPNVSKQYPQQSPKSSQVRKRRVSRRVVLTGLAGMVVAGGIILLLTWGVHSLLSGSSSNGITNLTISGSVVSVDLTNHSVTLNVNGQTKTINNIPDNVISNLQGQVGKFYAIQVTQNSDGSYSIVSGTNVTPEAIETPTSTNTLVAFKAGGISFIGPVKSIASSSLVMSAPNGQTYTMEITAQTDRSAFGGSLPTVGASVDMQSTINPNGSLTATILKPAQPGDPNLNDIVYTGITTSAVGSDRVLHFTAGVNSYTFTIPATADLSDFSGNAQAIGVNMSVKVRVQYPANTVVSVANA